MSTEVSSVHVAISSSGAPEVVAQLASVRAATQAMAGTGASFRLGVDASQIESASTALRGMETNALSAGAAMTRLAPIGVFAVATAGLTKMGADFQTLTTQIQNNTTMTGGDVQVMNETIKKLSAESGASFKDLGDGFMHAFNISGNAADAVKILTAANESAVSTGARTVDVTNSLAKVMHQFGIGASDAGKAMDELHLGAALGNTTLEEFVDHSAKSFVAASALHVPLDQVIAGFVGLTRAGFDASQANTQLASILTHIVTPSAGARKELELLSKQTGIDLVGDFSLAGLKAKGLTGVLQDLEMATRGNEDAILRVIPAQRGAIGALALTGSSAKDVKEAMDALAAVTDGRATPTMDAYIRTQATLGNQLAVLRQQMKLAATDIGSDMVPAVTSLVNLLDSIPEGVKKVGIELVMAGVGLSALSNVAGFIGAGLGKLAIKEAVTVEAASIETGAAEGGIRAAMAGLGTKMGPIAVGLIIGVAIAETIEAPLANDAITKQAQDTIRSKSFIEAEARRQTDFWRQANDEQLKANKDILVANYKNLYDQAAKELADYHPDKATQAATAIGLKDPKLIMLQTQLADTKRDMEEFLGYYDSKFNPNSGKTPEQIVAVKQEQEATAAAREHTDALREQSAVYLAMGANADTIRTALYGKDDGATAAQVKTATAEMKQLTQAYTEAEAIVSKLDFHKGLAPLIADAPKLQEIVETIRKLGQVPAGLQDLANIGSQFANIAAQEADASAAFNVYMGLLSGTNSRIGILDNLKKELDEGVKAAKAAQSEGVITPDQVKLLQNADTYYANILSTRTQLAAHKATELNQAFEVVPNLVKFDEMDLKLTQAMGGGKDLAIRLTADKTAALAAIHEVESGHYTATVIINGSIGSMPSIPAYGSSPASPAEGMTGFASGTSGAAPGWAWVGEKGPELVNFRGGETVKTNADSMRMMGVTRGYEDGIDDGGAGSTYGTDTVNYTIPGRAGSGGFGGVGGGPSPASSFRQATAAAKDLKTATDAVAHSLVDITNQARVFGGYLADLNNKDLKAVTAEFDHQFALLTKINQANLGPKATQAEKDAAVNTALTQSVDVAIAFAKALSDAENPANDLAADFQKIRDTGTPIAESLIRQASILREINIATAKIKDDQAALTALDDAHTQAVQERSAADNAAQRATTRAGWAEEDADRARQSAFAAQTRAEDDHWTKESRRFDDRRRLIEHEGTLKKRQLDDQLKGMEDQQKLAISGNKAAELQLGAAAAGASTNAQANLLLEQLALRKAADQTIVDNFTTQKEAINKAIQAEERFASDQLYNLETEKIAATRAHEDRVRQIDEASRLSQETTAAERTARQRAAQEQRWAIEDARLAEDARYKATKDALTDQLKRDQEHAKNLGDELTKVQSVEAVWEKVYQYAGGSASALLDAIQKIVAAGGGAPAPGVTPGASGSSSASYGSYGESRYA